MRTKAQGTQATGDLGWPRVLVETADGKVTFRHPTKQEVTQDTKDRKRREQESAAWYHAAERVLAERVADRLHAKYGEDEAAFLKAFREPFIHGMAELMLLELEFDHAPTVWREKGRVVAVVREKDVLHMARQTFAAAQDDTPTNFWTEWLKVRETDETRLQGAMKLATAAESDRAALFDRAVCEDMESHPAVNSFRDADVEARMAGLLVVEYGAEPKEAYQLAHEWTQAEFERRDPMKRALANGWTEDEFMEYAGNVRDYWKKHPQVKTLPEAEGAYRRSVGLEQVH